MELRKRAKLNFVLMYVITSEYESSFLSLILEANLCTAFKRHRCGIEHAIHSLREAFEQPETQAILLIDAKNAFNSLNRDLVLKNIEVLCPSLYLALSNSYKTPSNLCFSQSSAIPRGNYSRDSLAMAIYGLAILPLIEKVTDLLEEAESYQ